jgi:hypothetical protein
MRLEGDDLLPAEIALDENLLERRSPAACSRMRLVSRALAEELRQVLHRRLEIAGAPGTTTASNEARCR